MLAAMLPGDDSSCQLHSFYYGDWRALHHQSHDPSPSSCHSKTVLWNPSIPRSSHLEHFIMQVTISLWWEGPELNLDTKLNYSHQLMVPCCMQWLQVRAVLTELKSTRKIATATHNILAYRQVPGSV